MLSLYHSLSVTSFPSSGKAFNNSSSLRFVPRNPSISRVSFLVRACCTSNPNVDSESDESSTQVISQQRYNYAGIRLEESVDTKSGKLRLDSWISSRITGISRARVQSSIRSGLVSVNGRTTDKVYFPFCPFYTSPVCVFVLKLLRMLNR